MSARQGWLQSELSALQEEGLIPSPVATDPSLGKLRRVQPAGDSLWVDDGLLCDLQALGERPKDDAIFRFLNHFQDQFTRRW